MCFLQRIKRHGKIYYNNLFLTLFLITAMIISLFLYIIISNNNHIHSGVMSSENQHLDYYNAYASSEFDRLCMLVINLSTIVLEPDYNSSAKINNNENSMVNTIMSQNDSVVGISMTYSDINFKTGNISGGFTKKINTFKNVDFYCDEDYLWPANLQLVYDSNRSDTTSVIIEISLRKLCEAVNDSISGSENREFYITTNDGVILSSSEISRIFTNIGAKYKLTDNSISVVNKSGTDYYMITKKARVTGLYALSFADTSIYSASTRQNVIVVCLLGIVFICLSVLVSWIISKNTYKPVRQIMKTLSSKIPDDVSTIGSEVVLINNKIKELLNDNDELQQSLSSKIETLKQIQLRALQSQINPHFLYNTLDSLRWLSIDYLGDDNPVEQGLMNVNSIYKASVDYNVQLIPLREEVELSKSYIKIMLLRFGSSFDVEWKIDENALDYKILRFILQPLIENAFVHGKSQGEKTLISLEISLTDTFLHLEVSDNGTGMEEETLESIRRDFEHNSITDVGHVGTGNTNLRLHLLYGGHCKFKIESEVNVGTRCVIEIEKEYLK